MINPAETPPDGHTPDLTITLDPWMNPKEAEHEYGITPVQLPEIGAYDAIVLAVGHKQFAVMGAEKLREPGKAEHVLYNLKYIMPAEACDLRF